MEIKTMHTFTYKIKSFILLMIPALILPAFISGCDENGGITIPSGATELTVSVKSDDAADNPADVIVITEAKALISEVEFEQESNSNNQLHQRGPFVLNFILNGSLKEMGTQYIIRDNYTKIKFKIHKVEDGETPPDPEFKEGNSGNQRYSFIVKGTYNGNPFVYKSKKSANLVINLNKVTLINLKKQNITLVFNKLGWFKNGVNYVDPNNTSNEDVIDESIKTSFKRAFKDDNKDGLADDN